MSQSNNDSNDTPSSNPPIYKHLNAKTRGILTQVNKAIAAEEKEKKSNMSSEQT